MIRISYMGRMIFQQILCCVRQSNPCPCGHYPDMNRCRCTPAQVMQYLGRISQPLLDRLDLCAEVSPVDFEGLSSGQKGSTNNDSEHMNDTAADEDAANEDIKDRCRK